MYVLMMALCKVIFCPLLSLALVISLTSALSSYQAKIPNGARVPNPCDSNAIWAGVGHEAVGGSGSRNPFGLDFAKAGHTWSNALCKLDSDGDGKTNGEELGDPTCSWKEKGTPSRTTLLSHPGICEPIDSNACKAKNTFLNCANSKMNCTGFSESSIIAQNVTINRTMVPVKETTYMCQVLEIGVENKVVHFIGSLPIIKNAEILHHMLLFSCPPGVDVKPGEVFECAMNSKCNEIMDLWGAGGPGTCLNDQEGLIIDRTSGKKVYAVLQMHWNNPSLKNNQFDDSGFMMYLTEKLRPNNAGIGMYGQLKLDLPPKQNEMLTQHSCAEPCSNETLDGDKKITMALIHMHKYGVKGRVSLWRGGKFVVDLVPMHKYDYNTPIQFNHNPPILYRKGDVIKTECYFSTAKEATKYVYYGEGTQDEMCFSFFRYFPNNLTKTGHEKLSRCFGWKDLNLCYMNNPTLTALQTLKGCTIKDIIDANVAKSNSSIIDKICGPSMNQFCTNECKSLVKQLHAQEACLDPARGRIYFDYFLQTGYYMTAANRGTNAALSTKLKKCEADISMTMTTSTTASTGATQKGTGLSEQQKFILIIIGIVLGTLILIVLLGIVGMKFRQAKLSASPKSSQYNFGVDNLYVGEKDATIYSK